MKQDRCQKPDSTRLCLRKARLVVVKVGTGVLSNTKGGVEPARLKALASDVALLRSDGRKVILVTSGAIGSGMGKLELKKRPVLLKDLQTCAAIGQSLLMAGYDRYFSQKGLTVAQILLTHEDIRNTDRRQNARNTLLNLLKLGVVPVVNENDAVSTAEIKFGDNDQLASMVHSLVGADACILLSNVDGFYRNKRGQLEIQHHIQRITPSLVKDAGGSGSERSVGGMKSKLIAARRVLSTGKLMVIANGRVDHVLPRLFRGEKLGTLFASRFNN